MSPDPRDLGLCLPRGIRAIGGENWKKPSVSRGSNPAADFGIAFAELTGNRLPSTLAAGLNQVAQCYILPVCPHWGVRQLHQLSRQLLVVFFSAQNDRWRWAGLDELAVDAPEPTLQTDPVTGATTELTRYRRRSARNPARPG